MRDRFAFALNQEVVPGLPRRFELRGRFDLRMRPTSFEFSARQERTRACVAGIVMVTAFKIAGVDVVDVLPADAARLSGARSRGQWPMLGPDVDVAVSCEYTGVVPRGFTDDAIITLRFALVGLEVR